MSNLEAPYRPAVGDRVRDARWRGDGHVEVTAVDAVGFYGHFVRPDRATTPFAGSFADTWVHAGPATIPETWVGITGTGAVRELPARPTVDEASRLELAAVLRVWSDSPGVHRFARVPIESGDGPGPPTLPGGGP